MHSRVAALRPSPVEALGNDLNCRAAAWEIVVADPDEIRSEIRRLLDKAEKTYGPSIELAAIEAKWRDKVDSEEALRQIRDFLATGSILGETVALSEDSRELDREFRAQGEHQKFRNAVADLKEDGPEAFDDDLRKIAKAARTNIDESPNTDGTK